MYVGLWLNRRRGHAEDFTGYLIRTRPFKRHGRAGMTMKRHVIHNNESLQVLLQLVRPLRLAVDQHVVFAYEDSCVSLDMALNVEKESTNALPWPQAFHVVAAHGVNKLDAVFTGDSDSSAG